MKSRLSPFASGFLLALALAVAIAARAESAPKAGCANFSKEEGGYRVSAAFSLAGARHNVIAPPACLRAGDLLSIRPLRLNPDEYLVLQKCEASDCAQAEVVRAWNSSGYMGPYPVLTHKVPIQAGARYLLWMQPVPMPGTSSFGLIERYGPPLVFKPLGRLTAYGYAQRALRAATRRGPATITEARREDSTFVATFAGGSVVRIQALRPGS